MFFILFHFFHQEQLAQLDYDVVSYNSVEPSSSQSDMYISFDDEILMTPTYIHRKYTKLSIIIHENYIKLHTALFV